MVPRSSNHFGINLYSPLPGWIKCNTDGFFKPSGQAACGGLFHNCIGFVCGVFVKNLGIHTAFFVEFSAVLCAVEYAFQLNWKKVWFEMDSEADLRTFFDKNYKPPWQLWRR